MRIRDFFRRACHGVALASRAVMWLFRGRDWPEFAHWPLVCLGPQGLAGLATLARPRAVPWPAALPRRAGRSFNEGNFDN
jgi:hypothetical protein